MWSLWLLGFVGCLLLTAAPASSADNNKCPHGWIYVATSDRCYKWIRERIPWDAALDTCQELNATLAKIPSDEINRALLIWVVPGVITDNGFHIGLRYDPSKGYLGKWLWTDGSEADYTNEILSVGRLGECAEVSLDNFNHGRWYPVPCDKLQPAVCERPTTQTEKDNDDGVKDEAGSKDAMSVEKCKDLSPNCALNGVRLCENSHYAALMKQRCPKTCKLCQ